MVMSGRSVNLTTQILGRLRSPKQLAYTKCTYLTTARLDFRNGSNLELQALVLESAEGETKVCGQTGYPTRDIWLVSQTLYRLRYAVQLDK